MTDFTGSIEAMRDAVNESDLWTLADALLADIPQGSPRTMFDAVRAAALAAGVKPRGVSTLRQYRDTAAHWPPATRVVGVSFTAHRAAMRAADPGAMLRDLAATYGADLVTKGHVEAAMATAAGRVVPGTVTGTAGPVDLGSATPTDLAAALAASWRRDRRRVVSALSAPDAAATLAALAALVAEVNGTAAAAAVKSEAWAATPTPKTTPKVTPKVTTGTTPKVTPKGRLRG